MSAPRSWPARRLTWAEIDIDNAVKAICDAVNGICWVDDVQIVRLFATKAAAERPGIDIKIQPLAEFGE